MDLTEQEKKSVISVLKLYRSWMYHAVKEQNEDLDATSKTHYVNSLSVISSAQKKIELSLSADDDHDAPADSAAIPISSAKVLVADDDEISVELITSILEDIGFSDADVANDGQTALDKLSAGDEPYDLIICDWKMPNLTGLEVHAKAKASGILDNTIFMLLTAIDDDVLSSRAIKQGITEYLTKPVEVDDFEEKIKSYFV